MQCLTSLLSPWQGRCPRRPGASSSIWPASFLCFALSSFHRDLCSAFSASSTLFALIAGLLRIVEYSGWSWCSMLQSQVQNRCQIRNGLAQPRMESPVLPLVYSMFGDAAVFAGHHCLLSIAFVDERTRAGCRCGRFSKHSRLRSIVLSSRRSADLFSLAGQNCYEVRGTCWQLRRNNEICFLSQAFQPVWECSAASYALV